jgi:hypothetical protein
LWRFAQKTIWLVLAVSEMVVQSLAYRSCHSKIRWNWRIGFTLMDALLYWL